MFYTGGDASIASTQSTDIPVNNNTMHNPYTNEPHPIPQTINTTNRQTAHRDNYYTKNDLRNWLTEARTTGTTKRLIPDNPSTPHTTVTPNNASKHKKTHTSNQNTLQRHNHNPHWGDRPPSPSSKIFTIVSRSANTISTNNNLLQWRATAQALLEINANIACIQEPNVNWNPTLASRIQRIFQQQFGKPKLATSSSMQTMLSEYQPGGTATLSIGSSTSRLITTYEDPRGMGRWSALALRGKLNKTLIFIDKK